MTRTVPKWRFAGGLAALIALGLGIWGLWDYNTLDKGEMREIVDRAESDLKYAAENNRDHPLTDHIESILDHATLQLGYRQSPMARLVDHQQSTADAPDGSGLESVEYTLTDPDGNTWKSDGLCLTVKREDSRGDYEVTVDDTPCPG